MSRENLSSKPSKTQTGLLSHGLANSATRSASRESFDRQYTVYTANNNGADQPAQMHKLCVFVVRIWHKAGYHMISYHIFASVVCVPGFFFIITKTCLYNFDPLKPHFYIVKLGFTGVDIIFLISAQNIDYGYSLEPPRRGGSNEYPQSMFWAETWKYQNFFIWKCSFFGGKIFSVFE